VMVAPAATYDEIADWYEREFLASTAGLGADPLGIDAALVGLLGAGRGPCLEIGCGTGVRAARVRELGWTPCGIDLSAAMLGYGRARLPVALGDAARLPVRSSCLSAVISVMTHTDMPDYPAVLAEVTRVLRPGGRFVHIGVHPCFCGGFADRGNPSAVVIRPGYLDGRWTKASWTAHGSGPGSVPPTCPCPALSTPFWMSAWLPNGSPKAASLLLSCWPSGHVSGREQGTGCRRYLRKDPRAGAAGDQHPRAGIAAACQQRVATGGIEPAQQEGSPSPLGCHRPAASAPTAPVPARPAALDARKHGSARSPASPTRPSPLAVPTDRP